MGTSGAINAEAGASRQTRLGSQQVANAAGAGQVTSVNVQTRVAAAGGILQSVVVNGGPPLAGNGCGSAMLALSTSDGASWVRDGKTVRLDAVDPNIGITGAVVVSACGPGGQGDAFWTYTVPVP